MSAPLRNAEANAASVIASIKNRGAANQELFQRAAGRRVIVEARGPEVQESERRVQARRYDVPAISIDKGPARELIHARLAEQELVMREAFRVCSEVGAAGVDLDAWLRATKACRDAQAAERVTMSVIGEWWQSFRHEVGLAQAMGTLAGSLAHFMSRVWEEGERLKREGKR